MPAHAPPGIEVRTRLDRLREPFFYPELREHGELALEHGRHEPSQPPGRRRRQPVHEQPTPAHAAVPTPAPECDVVVDREHARRFGIPRDEEVPQIRVLMINQVRQEVEVRPVARVHGVRLEAGGAPRVHIGDVAQPEHEQHRHRARTGEGRLRYFGQPRVRGAQPPVLVERQHTEHRRRYHVLVLGQEQLLEAVSRELVARLVVEARRSRAGGLPLGEDRKLLALPPAEQHA